MIELEIEAKDEQGWGVLQVVGEVDIYSAPKLREKLFEFFNRDNYRLIVDLERVSFLDSTGLGVLIGALKKAREHNGDLILVRPSDHIEKILSITGLDKVFVKATSAEEAASAGGRQGAQR